MKAIIEVARKGSIFDAIAGQLAESRQGRVPDFHLSFESARALFAELTPARLDLLHALRQIGPCSISVLARSVERNYSNVHTDVTHLSALGLIAKAEDGAVSVPFEAVEILLPLAAVA